MVRSNLFSLAAVALSASLVLGCPNGRRQDDGGKLEASPELVDFGFVPVNQFSGEQMIELTNTGTESIEVQAPGWKDDESAAFELQLVPAETPFSLDPDDSETISTFFGPTTAGEFVAWIEVATDADVDGPLLIPVGGCSTDPDCTVTFPDPGDDDDSVDDDDATDDDDDATDDDDDGGPPDIDVDESMDFGNVAANQSAVGDVLQISNVGGEDLVVSSLDLSGADSSYFSIAGWSGGTIAPSGAPVNLNVSFDPYNAPAGAKNATLTIESNDPDESSVEVSLSANVTDECVDCPAELVIVGATPVDLMIATIYYLQVSTGTVEVTIQNTGSGTLAVEPVTTGGTYCTDNPAIELISGPTSIGAGQTDVQTWSVGQAGLEVVNFNGAYAFTMGTFAGEEVLMAVMGGEVPNCSMGI